MSHSLFNCKCTIQIENYPVLKKQKKKKQRSIISDTVLKLFIFSIDKKIIDVLTYLLPCKHNLEKTIRSVRWQVHETWGLGPGSDLIATIISRSTYDEWCQRETISQTREPTHEQMCSLDLTIHASPNDDHFAVRRFSVWSVPVSSTMGHARPPGAWRFPVRLITDYAVMKHDVRRVFDRCTRKHPVRVRPPWRVGNDET